MALSLLLVYRCFASQVNTFCFSLLCYVEYIRYVGYIINITEVVSARVRSVLDCSGQMSEKGHSMVPGLNDGHHLFPLDLSSALE